MKSGGKRSLSNLRNKRVRAKGGVHGKNHSDKLGMAVLGPADSPPRQNDGSVPILAPALPESRIALDVSDRLKGLIRLAREQGRLTYDDLNEALPGHLATSEDLDEVLIKLRALDIEVVDPTDFDELQSKLKERHARSRRIPVGGNDPLYRVPRKRTTFPGQHGRTHRALAHYLAGFARSVTGTRSVE